MGKIILSFIKYIKILLSGVIPFPIEVFEDNDPQTVGYSTLVTGYDGQVKGLIGINPYFPLHGLDKSQEEVVRTGVGVHECLHLLNTDFGKMEEVINTLPDKDRPCFRTVFNLVEDPAIEYHGHEMISQLMKKALKASIGYFYKNGGILGTPEDEDPYMEWIHAMILFGDVGIIRGTFQYSDAEDCFWNCLTMVLDIIKEPSGTKRVEMTIPLFEMVKPLWEDHQKNADAQSKMDQLMKKFGKGTRSTGASEAGQARTQIVSAEFGNPAENSPRDPSPADARREAMVSLASGKGKGGKDVKDAKASVLDISDADLEKETRIEKELENSLNKFLEGAAAMQDTKAEEHAGDYSQARPKVTGPCFAEQDTKYSVRTGETVPENAYGYDQFRSLQDVASAISVLRPRLKRAFKKKEGEELFTESGSRASVKRYKMPTAKVFSKRIEAQEKEKMEILFMVDVTGSMRGQLSSLQKNLIVILESVAQIQQVSVKIVTFSGDRPSYTHLNDDRWKNDQELRKKVCGMSAGGGTFLSHAIRYGGELLRQRHAKNKLLVLITDGDAEHGCYHKNGQTMDAKEDCANAVKDIRRFAEVIGIGIYPGSEHERIAIFESIFKKDFLIGNNLKMLVEKLPYLIERKIR